MHQKPGSGYPIGQALERVTDHGAVAAVGRRAVGGPAGFAVMHRTIGLAQLAVRLAETEVHDG